MRLEHILRAGGCGVDLHQAGKRIFARACSIVRSVDLLNILVPAPPSVGADE
jgi:hypothetical protein